MIQDAKILFRLPPLVLGTWGSLMLYLAASGHLRTLLNPLFWPLEISAGAGLVLMAAGYLFLFQPVGGVLDRMAGHRMMWQAGALLIPVSIAALNVPDSLSAAALQARSALSGGRILAQMATPNFKSDSPSLIDFATAAYYPEHIPEVSNRTVTYLGQILPGGAPGEFRFCRVLISCCAADATPIYLTILGPQPDMPIMRWITVKGTTFFRNDDEGNPAPCLHMVSVQPSPAPPDTYLYAVRLKSAPSP